MQIFATLAELGSFTKTADAAQIGRPQVTHAIQNLEASLGVRLLHRTTRKVSLTAEGEVFYERVIEILNNIAEAKSLFNTNGRNVRGRLRVDLPVALAQPRFMVSLREFKRAYPDVSLVVGVTDRALDLVAEGVDCVIRIGELSNSSMIGRRIGTAAMVTCAAPDYLNEFGHPTDLDDLSRHHAVKYFSGNARKSMEWTFMIGGEEKIFNLRAGILVNDSNAYVEAGLAGFGIMQALGISVDSYLTNGSLVEVLPQFRPRSRPVSVLYPSKVHLAPQVRVFIDWATECFAQLHGDWLEP
jgi:LysR family transcriptional regulator for bpeEF and oprC